MGHLLARLFGLSGSSDPDRKILRYTLSMGHRLILRKGEGQAVVALLDSEECRVKSGSAHDLFQCFKYLTGKEPVSASAAGLYRIEGSDFDDIGDFTMKIEVNPVEKLVSATFTAERKISD